MVFKVYLCAFVAVIFLQYSSYVFCQSGFNYQKCNVLGWTERGCKIAYHHNLTILIDDRAPNSPVKIDWDNVNDYVHDLLCRCRKLAKERSYQWFAVEKDGICLSHSGTLSLYLQRYPLDDNSKCGAGRITITGTAPDGVSSCVPGVYRAYFYDINDVAGNPGANPTEPVFNPEPTAGEPTAGNPTPSAGEPTRQVCTQKSDLSLLIDASGSVTPKHFQLVKKFLNEFLDHWNFGDGQSRVSIATYDTECYMKLTWLQSSKLKVPALRKVINDLPYTGGSTRTDLALQCAYDMIKVQQRSNVPKTVCVVTDGISFRSDDYMPPVVAKLQTIQNLHMVAIGVGDDVNRNELEKITGNKFKDNIIELKDFEHLIKSAVSTLNKIVQKVCT